MDLDALATRYEGEALLQRLLFVARTSSSSQSLASSSQSAVVPPATDLLSQSRAAYQLAADHMRRSGNVHRYKEVFGAFDGGRGSSGGRGSHSNNRTPTRNVASFGTVGNSATPGHVNALHNSPEGVVDNNNTTTTATTTTTGVVYDAAWVARQEQTNRQARDILASRLGAAQSHLHKDAIRAAYLALSEHDSRTGDPAEAFHSVLRAKDCCTTRHQTATVSLRILELSVQLQNYSSVRDYVTKLEHTLGTFHSSSSSTTTGAGTGESASAGGGSSDGFEDVRYKVKIASALDALHRRDYDRAALLFRDLTMAAPSSSGSSSSGSGNVESTSATAATAATTGWSTVLAGEEIALYAAFLALAQSSRQQMVALAQHPEALELVPPLREALQQFGGRADYKRCWQILDGGAGTASAGSGAFRQLAHDMAMAPHLAALQDRIRQRAMLNAWQPYQRISFADLASELGSPGLVPSPDALVAKWADLIAQGRAPDTRLNVPAGLLVREVPDVETVRFRTTQSRLARTTKTVLDDVYGLVVRLACLEHDLVVGDGTGGGGGGGGGGRQLRGKRRVGGGRKGSGSHAIGGGASYRSDAFDFGGFGGGGIAEAGGAGAGAVVMMGGDDSSAEGDDDVVDVDDEENFQPEHRGGGGGGNGWGGGDDDDEDDDDDDEEGIDEVEVADQDDTMDTPMIDAGDDMNPEDLY